MCPRALPLLLVIMGVLPCSKAQQYDLRNFELEQGLPSNTVKALCEDQEGFLWIATDEGVARSEGSHFQVLGTENGSPENDVTELYCAPDGAVWMGYRRGSIAVWRHGRISPLRARSSAQAAVSGITSDSGGVTWVATQDGGIERFAMDGSSLGTANLDRAGARINALCTDHQGRVVAGTDEGLFQQQGDALVRAPVSDRLPSARITCLHADSIGVLVGTDNGYAELTTDLEWLPPSERFTGYFPIALPDTRVITALRGRSGDLWFGTPSGAAHFTKHNGQPRLRTISEANGLGHAVVRCLLQDRSGAVWIGTGFGGVSKFTSDAFIHYTERDGLRSRTVGAMHRTPDGVLWIGTVGGGLARLEQDGLHTLGVEHGLTDPFILGLGEDQEGHLLVATATRGLFRYKNDRFVRYTAASGMDADRVNVVHLDDNGRIWAGAANGLFLDPGDGLFTHIGEPTMNVTDVVAAGDTAWFTTDQGLFVLHLHQLPWRPVAVVHLPPVAMNTLERDGQGNLWIGTQQHGLYRCRNTFVDSINMDHGLGSRNVEQVMLDAYENIWLGTRNGVDMLELDVLQERVLEVEHFGADEGFIGIGAFRNACMLDTDSALWFGTVRGATRYDPRAVLTDTREPLIHLTDLRLFNERVDWTPWSDSTTTAGLPQNLELPHDRNHLTFAFTGISLAYPEKVRYRYMLEGHDPDWSPITATDKVTYTNLPPGEYTFRILARNASGIWTQQAADFKFSIDPPFWATTPFRIGAGGLLLLGLFGVVRFRERSLRRDRERLEGMVQVRTSELAREKDRSDALLLNILPSSTAEELRTKGSADARRYESCTVLFSDFKGFTGYSSLMDSDTLVAELDHYFRMFDRITDTYGTEKIKTIGDAYMCASGVPTPKTHHALDALLTALEMVHAVEGSNAERRSKGLQEWPVRIGLHTGPVVAGVVGEKKFAYDIWGDTVNLASRMESNGEAGLVNISGVTYAQVMEYVEARPRGPIKVKGKGELHMYFVLRLRPEFSADAKGLLPNAELLAIRQK